MKNSKIILLLCIGTIISYLFIACSKQPSAKKTSDPTQINSDSPDVWEQLTRNAVVALKEGNPEKAMMLCSNALDFVSRTGKEDLRTVKTYMLSGEIYRWQKKHNEAEMSFKRAIEVCEKVVGPNHKDMAIPLESLANLYYFSLHDLEKVAGLYLRILKIAEASAPPDYFQEAVWSSNLGIVYQEMQQYEKAEPFFIKALTVSESGEQFTKDDIAQYLYICANFYHLWGKCREAGEHALKLVIIRENNLEGHIDESFNLANSLDVLGSIYLSCNEPEKAVKQYKRSLGIIEKALEKEDIRNGPMQKEHDHPDMAIHLTGLAKSLKHQGKYTDANLYYQKAFEITKKFMGPDAVETAYILEKYAESLELAGAFTEAGKAIQRAKTIRGKISD